MKKKLLALSILCVLATTAMCQPFYTNLDTIQGIHDKYYYCEWYSDCPDYYSRDSVPKFRAQAVCGEFTSPSVGMFAKEYHTPKPMKIKGLVAMVTIRPEDVGRSDPFHLEEHSRGPEYMKLLQWVGTTDSMIEVGEVQWDTATPHIMRLPLSIYGDSTGDTNHLFFCYAYEAYFDKPLVVDSFFYIAGTYYNNVQQYDSIRHFWYYPHLLTRYVYIQEKLGVHGTCPVMYGTTYWKDMNPPTPWINFEDDMGHHYGYFLPIVDKHTLRTAVDSSCAGCGMVEGGGVYYSGNPAVIEAFAHEGYKFFQWDDGNRENPRSIVVLQDTLLTATFIDSNAYEVATISSDERMGDVQGGGFYWGGDTITLTAIALDGYRFSQWNDGDTSNPRQVVVTQDTSFTAYFDTLSDTTGIAIVSSAASFFTLTPNPTDGKVIVEVSGGRGTGVIALCDATGREVLKQKASVPTTLLDLSKLPAGTYFVTVTIGGQSGTRKLVVK